MVGDQVVSKQAQIMEALAIRNRVDLGFVDRPERHETVSRLIVEGLWSDRQIASIMKLTPGYVYSLGHDSRALRAASPASGAGRLDRGSLDLLLELSAITGELTDGNRALLRACLSTGTGSRLVSHLTGISLGAILYVQRNDPEREVVRRGVDSVSE